MRMRSVRGMTSPKCGLEEGLHGLSATVGLQSSFGFKFKYNVSRLRLLLFVAIFIEL